MRVDRGFFLFFSLFSLFSLSFSSFCLAQNRIVSTNLCIDYLLIDYVQNQKLNPNRIIALSPFYKKYNQIFLYDFPTHSGSIESIFYLKPDLILMGAFDSFQKKQSLKKLGLNIQTLPFPQNLQELKLLESAFLNALNLPQNLLKPTTLPVLSSLHSAQKARVLLLGANFIATGKNTFENDLIQHFGFQNAVDFDGFHVFSLEKIVLHPPDFLIFTTPLANNSLASDRLNHPFLKNIPTLFLNDWRLQCAGPWSLKMLENLKK